MARPSRVLRLGRPSRLPATSPRNGYHRKWVQSQGLKRGLSWSIRSPPLARSGGPTSSSRNDNRLNGVRSGRDSSGWFARWPRCFHATSAGGSSSLGGRGFVSAQSCPFYAAADRLRSSNDGATTQESYCASTRNTLAAMTREGPSARLGCFTASTVGSVVVNHWNRGAFRRSSKALRRRR